MAVALIGAIAGLAGAGVSAYSASSASKASKADKASEEKRRKELLAEIDKGRAAAEELREERDIPSELFADILRRYPGMLDSILPALTARSVTTTDTLADANLRQFTRLREGLAPGSKQLDQERLDQIFRLNPDRMGQEDILSITRKLAPLLPSGTLDPSTGAVAGGVTSPGALYRNLISSQFSQRRNEFLNQSRLFSGDIANAATRQQVSAADFLSENLNRAFTTSAALTGADVEQQQADIDAQEEWIKLAAGGLASQYDPSANNAAIAAGTQGTVSSLAAAAEALARIGKN